jgi:predicted TIM-barrel fold metal-dependent hydrolase
LTQLLVSGVFEHFPRLKFVITEQGCSWVPPLLKQLDLFHRQMQEGRVGELKFTPDQVLPRSPSEYFRRNVWMAASFPSPVEAASRHAIGPDRFLWGSDYPHDESSWPHTREALRRAFADASTDELRQVLGGNAAEVFGFDLDTLAPIAERVGPTIDELRQPYTGVPEGNRSPAFVRD